MVSSTVLLFFLSAIFILTAQSAARPDFLYHLCIPEKGNYSANSTYEANFNELLLSLSSTTEIDHGFYHSAYGQNSDQVYATGLCRGDVSPDVCHGCLNDAASLLTKHCPQQKEAIGWYDECMLRYSNRSILGVMETSPSFFMPNPNNVSADYVDQFNDDLRTLVESLRTIAAAGGPHLKFAAANTTAPNSQTLYALEQCTPDLSEQDCNNCLLGAFQGISQCCDGKDGGRVLRPSCNIRFEVYPFYDGTIAASPGTSTDTRPPAYAPVHNRGPIGLIIFVLTVACAALISMGIYMSVKGILKNNRTSNESPSIELRVVPVSSDIEANKPVQGGYGAADEDKPNRNASNKDKLIKKIRMAFGSMYKSRKKKDESFVSTPIYEKINEIQGQGLIPHPMPKSDDDAAMPSSSTSQLEHKLIRYEEEVNSMKRQLAQQQQEMEAKQREMDQQIVFLRSQLQIHRDVPPT